MSRDQWAAIQHGDESYAGSPSWYRFLEAVQVLFRSSTSSRRTRRAAGQRILFSVLGGPGGGSSEQHALRRRARTSSTGAEARLPIAEGRDPSALHPFKGNMDTEALEALLAERAADVPVVFVDHEQLGRRPALAREPPRGARDLRSPRRAAVPRCLPLRRERVVHP